MHELRPGDVILSVNPGHDGAVAVIQDSHLLLSAEAEHDSQPRHRMIGGLDLLDALGVCPAVPAAIATSGWPGTVPRRSAWRAPYHGIGDDAVRVTCDTLLGKPVVRVESSHERSHIFCAHGLSPFPQGQPFYVLVWEGSIGCFYEIDETMRIRRKGPVLSCPGYRYSFLFDLADPTVTGFGWRLDTAGKLMALSGFARSKEVTLMEQTVIDRVLDTLNPVTAGKQLFSDTPYVDCGVTDAAFCDLVAKFSTALFDRFYRYAEKNLKKHYPLLIAGGCGLNCEWNSSWRDTNLFEDVFVPPVANDSGTAIGSAIEAQYLLSGNAKVTWSVYSGYEFVEDGGSERFLESELDYEEIAASLAGENVICWVQGRSEIGPRALGNRSLLASPFRLETRDRLNRIKQREWYRPIAPVCLAEDAPRLFGAADSPYMLYFHKTSVPELRAVTHVDGSARVQTVTREQNAPLYNLLIAFRKRTGFGVLCNTSLNRKGKGFINRSQDLFSFAAEKGVDAVIINSKCYRPVAPSCTETA